MRYTDRLADAGIAPSVGSQGDAFDNALAESVIGLYKTEVIRRERSVANARGGGVRNAGVDWVESGHRDLSIVLRPIGEHPAGGVGLVQYYAQVGY